MLLGREMRLPVRRPVHHQAAAGRRGAGRTEPGAVRRGSTPAQPATSGRRGQPRTPGIPLPFAEDAPGVVHEAPAACSRHRTPWQQQWGAARAAAVGSAGHCEQGTDAQQLPHRRACRHIAGAWPVRRTFELAGSRPVRGQEVVGDTPQGCQPLHLHAGGRAGVGIRSVPCRLWRQPGRRVPGVCPAWWELQRPCKERVAMCLAAHGPGSRSQACSPRGGGRCTCRPRGRSRSRTVACAAASTSVGVG
jgi:hypothetical protein